MSHEITTGSILGGRYLVTGEVVSTAEGDVVFDGTDQVLNRAVSILVAAPANATRVAVSAREVAMGTRPSAAQVLDLGLQGDSTYLITNTVDAPDLLDLAVESDAPYIEPFQTDTLGQEIFGEPRPMEPQVYGDDAEYYEELAQESSKRRLFGRRKRQQEETAPTGEQDHVLPPAVSPDQAQADLGPTTGPFAAQPMAASEAAKSYPSPTASNDDGGPVPDDAEPSQPAVTELPAAGAAAGAGSGSGSGSGDDGAPRTAETETAAAAAPLAPATASAGGSGSSGGSRFPREAAAAASARPASTEFIAASGNEEGSNRVVRLIVGLVLVLVLVVGVVFAVQFLTKSGDKNPTADPKPTQSQPAQTDKDDEGKGSDKPTEAPKAKPSVEGITKAAPDVVMNTNNDADLSNAVDGQASTIYKTFSYKSAVFGGLTDRLVLQVKLKEEADISSVDLSGLNGTGGKVQVLVGDSEDPEAADERFSGSFSGPTLSADLGSGSDAAKGQYVFISITELPRLASGGSTYPYGFQVAEIKVN
ncbi:MAG: hypothetical protein ACTII7_12535 [Galactobacter sp.]